MEVGVRTARGPLPRRRLRRGEQRLVDERLVGVRYDEVGLTDLAEVDTQRERPRDLCVRPQPTVGGEVPPGSASR